MVAELVAALVVGFIGYIIGVGRGSTDDRFRIGREADAKHQALRDQRGNEKIEAEQELKRALKQLMAMYEQELFWLRVTGRSIRSFTSFAADIKWSGRDDYDENHILFPTADDARRYGEALLKRYGAAAGAKAEGYRITTCYELPNALWEGKAWMFAAADNADVYVEVGRPRTRSLAVAKWGRGLDECWVPRTQYPAAWGVEGDDNARFRTIEEAYLHRGYLALTSDEFYSAKVVEKNEKPNAICYDGKLGPLG